MMCTTGVNSNMLSLSTWYSR